MRTEASASDAMSSAAFAVGAPAMAAPVLANPDTPYPPAKQAWYAVAVLALAEPYNVTTLYRRDRQGSLIEFQCAENDRNPINEAGETQFE